MPGLKKLSSQMKLGKGDEGDGEPATDGVRVRVKKTANKLLRKKPSLAEEQPAQYGMLNFARPAFAKRSTANSSLPRQYSWEAGQSIEDFAAELDEANLLARQLSIAESSAWHVRRQDSGGLAARHGLKINTEKLKERNASALASPDSPEAGDTLSSGESSVIGRYGFAPHPGNVADPSALGTALQSASHAQTRCSSNNPFRPASSSTMSSEENDPLGSASIPGPANMDNNPYRNGMVPAIRDINWDSIDEQDVAKFVQAYNEEPSPKDSAVSLSDNESPQPYVGKGKQPATNVPWSMMGFLGAAAQRIPFMGTSQPSTPEASEAEDRKKALEIQEQLRKEQEEADRLAAQRARLRDCVVCGDSKDPFDFPAKPPTKTCAHRSQTCTDCLQSWMASEIDGKGASGIICPECPEKLSALDVERAASPETYKTYDTLLLREALGSDADFAWCLSPSCGSGQINEANNNFMDCASCGYKQCLKHRIPWHKGETCEQYEYRTSGQQAKDEEEKTNKMIDEVSRKCPGKNCGWRIQKTEGCDHMTCRKCRHQFCYLCLASQEEIRRVGNTAHEKSCKCKFLPFPMQVEALGGLFR
jgi:hypothetical protein